MEYRYVKAPIKTVYEYQEPRKESKWRKLLPSVLLTLGSIMVANVVWPLVSGGVLVGSQLRREQILSPLPAEFISVIPQARSLQQEGGMNNPLTVLGTETDYTNARNWFPTAEFISSPEYGVETYSISIPALDIEDAQVIIGGVNLEEGLIQYPGTSIPGQPGSPVIFGHSILRRFYAPQKSNPDRYVSIFSTIMTLDNGEEITVDYDGITYTYKVKEKVVVKPEDVFILQQQLNTRELKLVTCFPEGTYLERGIVIAELVDVKGL